MINPIAAETPEFVMCPLCKGRKTVYSIGGMTAICDLCDGKGVIKYYASNVEKIENLHISEASSEEQPNDLIIEEPKRKAGRPKKDHSDSSLSS
jgi:hypothetical protein